jgi:tRNA pseudouridine38-40 synthase
VEKAPPGFHARHDAVARTYLYRISRRRTAFDKRFVWWVRDRLDFSAMTRAAKLFGGRHDFASFCENPEGQESTLVVVNKSELLDWGHEIHCRVEASHFLWKMVRRLVGALVEVGRGNLSEADAQRLLTTRSTDPAQWTAPPSGLFLEKVTY